MTFADEKTFTIEDIRVPDSSLARCDHAVGPGYRVCAPVPPFEPGLLLVCAGRRRRALKFDNELLYAGAMFHDMGLTPAHRSAHERFEVDGANVARDFLRSRGIDQHDIDTVWTAIALHTTPASRSTCTLSSSADGRR